MPLILSVTEGDRLEIGKDLVEVGEVYGDGEVDLYVKNELAEIDDSEMVEILPDVQVSAGLLSNNQNYIRLIIKAPRSIPIGIQK